MCYVQFERFFIYGQANLLPVLAPSFLICGEIWGLLPDNIVESLRRFSVCVLLMRPP